MGKTFDKNYLPWIQLLSSHTELYIYYDIVHKVYVGCQMLTHILMSANKIVGYVTSQSQ